MKKSSISALSCNRIYVVSFSERSQGKWSWPRAHQATLNLRSAALATKLMDHASLQTPAVHPESLDLIFQPATCFPILSYLFLILLTSTAAQRERKIALEVSSSNLKPDRESISRFQSKHPFFTWKSFTYAKWYIFLHGKHVMFLTHKVN